MRNLFAGIAVAIGILCAAEGLLRAFDVDPSPRTFLINPQDGRKTRVFAENLNEIAQTTVINAVEVPFTAPDPRLIFRVRQNEEHTPLFRSVGINALGFRGRSIRESKGGRKILVLGDSCGFGWGISDIGKTFPSRLESLLLARGIPAEVYNLSQPGYSTTQGLLLYREWQPVIRPEAVVLYFGWNDIWNTPKLTDRQTISMLRYANSPLIKALLSSRISSVMRAVLQPGNDAGSAGAGDERAARNEALPRRVPVPEALDNYREMCASGRVFIILPPIGHTEPTPMPEYKRAVRNGLSSRATLIEMPEMEGPMGAGYFLSDGYHPNEYGAAVIPARLADQLGEYFEKR